MFSLDIPAGSRIHLTAAARANCIMVHRWHVRLRLADYQTAALAPPLGYGSRIGGSHREQQIDIPAQTADYRLDVSASHQNGSAWEEDYLATWRKTPVLLLLAFGSPSSAPCQPDVLLSFHLTAPAGEA
jgi:hypothetical protein